MTQLSEEHKKIEAFLMGLQMAMNCQVEAGTFSSSSVDLEQPDISKDGEYVFRIKVEV